MSIDHDPWGRPDRRPEEESQSNTNRKSDSPPNLDEVLGKLGGLFKNKGSSGNSGNNASGQSTLPSFPNPLPIAIALVVAVCVVWIGMGFYVVDQQERGVVLRLGKFDNVLEPGLRWQPFLIDRVTTINVTRVREQQFNSEMLTVDENIVDVKTSVQYVVSDPRSFALAVRAPEEALSLATDSALRHVVGSTDLDNVITVGRERVANEVQQRLQQYLDSYNSGLQISKVNILESKAPDEVKSAFDDVIKAREDRVRVINQATTYENGVVPQARGQAERMLEEANGYREATIARATGEAERFSKLASEYILAPEVTSNRLYLQTMEKVLQQSSKVLIDSGEGSNNLLYLPLDQIVRNAKQVIGTNGQVDSVTLQQLTDDVIEQIRQRQPDQNFSSSSSTRQSRQLR